MPLSRREFLLSGMALVAGCAPVRDHPPLEELYRYYGGHEQPPLVLIPGAFGSRLRDRDTGKELWPGSETKLLFSNYKGLEVDIEAATLEPNVYNVEPYQIFEQGLGRDFYGQVLAMLETAGGYRQRQPGDAIDAGQRNYYVFLYDWRLDNTKALQNLHAFIERIRDDYQDPTLKVDILAHSNGGMLARYYARYGTVDNLDSENAIPNYLGARAIRRLLLVGTPNLGTVQPVLSLIRGEDIGFRKIPPDIVATTTGAPQLMPHPSIPSLIDMQGKIIEANLFDLDTWRDFKWCIFNNRIRDRARDRKGGGASGDRHLAILEQYLEKHLLRGRNFMTLMSQASGPDDIRPYVFGGDCEPTLARIVVEELDGELVAHERSDSLEKPVPDIDYENLMYDPGDMVVTRTSLLGRCEQSPYSRCDQINRVNLRHSVFICEKHQTLTGNSYFQDNILHTLLSRHEAS